MKHPPLADSAGARRLTGYRRAARGKTIAQLTIEWADSVLSSPARIPPLPRMAAEHAARMAQVESNPKELLPADARTQQRKWQYHAWLADVTHEIQAHGIRVLQSLERYCPDDAERFTLIEARVAMLLRAVRELPVPWWPIHRLTEEHEKLTLPSYCERELGRLVTREIKRSGRGQRSLLETPAASPADWFEGER